MDARASLTPEDLEVLATVGRGRAWMRAMLCTLARRGVALRLGEPGRAAALLDALAPLPYYKGGQFLFDLLEWDDFMVDGPPPPVLPTTLDSRALQRLATVPRRIQAHLDGAIDTGRVSVAWPDIAVVSLDDTLPPLEPGYHLYDDGVLGVLATIAP
jgi:hypothetical protein